MASERRQQSKGPILALVFLTGLALINYVVLSQRSEAPTAGLLAYFIGVPIVLGILLFVLLRQAAPAQRESPTPGPLPPAEPLPPRVMPLPPKPSAAPALTLLAALQAEGRLVDFLQEPIAGYSDEQIGAAVRAIHEGCRKAMGERLTLEPVLQGTEGDSVVIPEGFDPSAIRLTGNVSGHPPFRGTLRHPGWRAVKVKIAERPAGQDPDIIAPAEVEIP